MSRRSISIPRLRERDGVLQERTIEISFREIWDHVLNDEEKQVNGIWLSGRDVSTRSRYDPACGMTVMERYEPQIAMHPSYVRATIGDEVWGEHDRDTILRDIKIEMLKNLQGHIEEKMIRDMLKYGQERDFGIPVRAFYDISPRRGGTLNLKASIFPSFHIPNGEILMITDMDTYHRFIVPTLLSGEVPYAPIGKIKWIPIPRLGERQTGI
jgi:hypothetical protein